MIHSAIPQSRPAVMVCFVLVDFEKRGRTYVQTEGRTTCVNNIVITTGRDGGRPRGSIQLYIMQYKGEYCTRL